MYPTLAAIHSRLDSSSPDEKATVIAVSKTFDSAAIHPVLASGHRDFGENRVQEAQHKWPALKEEFPHTTLHLIGPLQTNKVADACALFDVIHTVDREKLARALVTHAEKTGHCPDLLIQVNTGSEPQKAGILPEQASAFITLCTKELNLPVKGLMCIPPIDAEPAPHFAYLRQLAQDHGFAELSMGMSKDYMVAANLGATMIRVGTAVFGERHARA